VKVLLVDDDPTMRETLGEIARRAFGDVRIRTAYTLTEGLQQARVLVVSALEDRACAMAALEAGAAGYLPKTSPLLTMLAAVRLVSQGGTYIPPQSRRAAGVRLA
jgi:DNA-binding NarL/FixJ family response regulator